MYGHWADFGIKPVSHNDYVTNTERPDERNKGELQDANITHLHWIRISNLTLSLSLFEHGSISCLIFILAGLWNSLDTSETMASDFSSCPICIDDYDLDQRIPKSLDCRHSLCKGCLMHEGKPLKQCPSCRQPINNPGKVVNDLTMIDYLERKRQKRRDREQADLKKQLRFLQETLSKELKATQSQLDGQKQSYLDVAERKMNEFTSYARCMFNER